MQTRIETNKMSPLSSSNASNVTDKRDIQSLFAALIKGDWSAAITLKIRREPKRSEDAAAYWIGMGIHSWLYGEDKQKCFDKCVEIGAPAIPYLIKALQSERVHDLAAQALDKLDWHPDNSEQEAMYWIARHEWDKCLEIGSAAVNPLINLLTQQECKKHAVELLGLIGDKRAVKPLLNILASDHDAAIIKALGQIGDERAVNAIVDELSNAYQNTHTIGSSRDKQDYYALRDAAIEALGNFQYPDLVETILENICVEENGKIHDSAEMALIKMGTMAVEPLIRYLESGQHIYQDRVAARVLGKIGDKRAVNSLISILQRAPVVYDNPLDMAIDFVKKQDLNELACRAAMEALVEIGDEHAVEPFIAKLSDRNYFLDATDALARLGSNRAVEPLAAYLRKSLSHEREAAAKALIKIGDSKSIEPIILVLANPTLGWKSPSEEGAGEVRRTTIKVLKAITGQDFGEDVEKWQQWSASKMKE